MSDTQRLLQIKAALVAMSATQGWTYVRQIADNVVNHAKDSILDGKTAAEREEAALKATALRNGFRDLFNAIDAAKQFGDSENDWLSAFTDPEQSEELHD